MGDMVISFIISAFNRPLSLHVCLASLVIQTDRDWEAIVVDNSTDDSARQFHSDLCEMDDRIRYQYTGDHTGITDTMHTRSLYHATELGAASAKGQWLSFPNDDSYYCPWFVERMRKGAMDGGWDLVYCDLVAGGPGGHYLLQAEPKLCQIDKTNFIVRAGWFHGFSQGAGASYPQADGIMIEELVRRGIRHGRVPEILVVHN